MQLPVFISLALEEREKVEYSRELLSEIVGSNEKAQEIEEQVGAKVIKHLECEIFCDTNMITFYAENAAGFDFEAYYNLDEDRFE